MGKIVGKVRFGVIGCGGIARWHIESVNALDDAVLMAVCDASASLAEAFGEAYKVPHFTEPAALMASGLVDAVCICTPSGVHAQQCIAALEAGLHVVVEKPMAITPESLAAVLAAEKKAAGRLTCISQYRYSPDMIRAKEILKGGSLGKITTGDLSMK
jgi:predicted dehydrogenase